MGTIIADYKDEVVFNFDLGDSFEGRPIKAYALMLGTTEELFQKELISRRSILINGVHHARELTTISQVAFTMIQLLHGIEHGKKDVIALLENAAVIFIPAVNIDGYSYISDQFKSTGRLEFIRKNRNVYEVMKNCGAEFQGVDLNRNYDYKFGYNDDGSSGS